MTLAAQIADDLDWVEDQETVTYTSTHSVSGSEITVAGITAKQYAIRTGEQVSTGGVFLSQTTATWQIKASLLDPTVTPKEGDTIADAASDIWQVDSVEKVGVETRYLFQTHKQP